jgi:hypothetical protein
LAIEGAVEGVAPMPCKAQIGRLEGKTREHFFVSVVTFVKEMGNLAENKLENGFVGMALWAPGGQS